MKNAPMAAILAVSAFVWLTPAHWTTRALSAVALVAVAIVSVRQARRGQS